MVKIDVLSSGSSGNAILIKTKKSLILIDNGLSYKKFKELISMVNLEVGKINYLLITHEHDDHIKGVPLFLKNNPIPTFVSRNVAEYLKLKNGSHGLINFIKAEKSYDMGDFEFTPFALPHDASETFGYVIKSEGIKIGYAADLGTAGENTVSKLKGSNCLMVEFNHDLDMLKNSFYPEPIKLRIAGKLGHLSNEQGKKLLSKCVSPETQAIYLMHLSKETNTKEFALLSAFEMIFDRKIFVEATNHIFPSKPFIF